MIINLEFYCQIIVWLSIDIKLQLVRSDRKIKCILCFTCFSAQFYRFFGLSEIN